MIEWPKKPVHWIDDRTLLVSVPFTWNLPAVREELTAGSLLWDRAIVGGPAVLLMPDYLAGLSNMTIGTDMPGVLQRVNPLATRTTTGCVRHCRFCAIGTGAIEPGGLQELPDWPDLPVISDNNLLAASMPHFERVVERLARWGWADFNQGMDARLLTSEHANCLAQIKRPMIRLAVDSMAEMEAWKHAFNLLRSAGIAKRCIRSYCLIAFNDTPRDAWRRCMWVESHGIKALPMWFHRLDQLVYNEISPQQQALGWDHDQRRQIMGYFYRHRGQVPAMAVGTETDPAIMAGSESGVG